MTNFIDEDGLHIQTLSEIVTELEDGFKEIYGDDINIDPNSPDAQAINIYAQSKVDTLDAITEVYNSFDPDSAVGRVLDARCAINGIIRVGATYTRTNVTIEADRVVTIYGLDDTDSPFTVSDDSGNLFYLAETTTLDIGSNICEFRAAEIGRIETTIGTITTIITITLGVLSVTNPTSATYTGIDEETDAALRLRRQRSVALASTGYLDGLTGALLAVDNVTDARVYENNTGEEDENGIPEHSIWCIVDGGEDADIADIIYRKRNAGCGMHGSETVSVPQVNGMNIVIKFDRPTYEELYIDIVLQPIDPAQSIDTDYIKDQIYERIVYDIYDPADFTEITSLVKELDSNVVVISGGVSSDGETYDPFIYPSTIASKWVNSVSRISISEV